MKDDPHTLEFFQAHQEKIYKNTDRLFAVLMIIQFFAGIAIAWIVSPSTWIGTKSTIHPHIWSSVLLGGIITSLPVFLALKFPGEKMTRYIIAVSQMLMSSLLIHLTGGRIETHFHIFGSLAFLAFYRDWRVLIPATIVTTADHIFRGWLYPQSVYGVLSSSEWRWIEHACWVIFEDIFLIVLCRQSVKELWEIAESNSALNSSEERYRAVAEQTTDGIALIEPIGLKIIDCNESFGNLFGYKNTEETKNLIGLDFTTLDYRELERITGEVMNRKKAVREERLYRRCDGSVIQVEINTDLITYKGKKVFCLSVKDITKRKQAEEEMKRLAIVVEKTQNSVIVSDPDGYIQWVNEGFTRMMGYEAREVIGKHPADLLCGAKTNRKTLKAIFAAVRANKPFDGELYSYRKDRSGLWVSISLTPITDENGRLTGYISIETDINERKEMENALRQTHDGLEQRVAERTEELLQANRGMWKEVVERKRAEIELSEAKHFLHKVIDNIPNMIFVKDARGCYTLANRSIAELYGVEVEDMLGKTDAELIQDSQEAEIFLTQDHEVIKTQQETFIYEEKFTDSKGNIHWLQTVKRPMFGKSGVENVLGIATDLTERKILENQLRRAQKLESIGQLAAGIAHEINTPTQYVSDNTHFVRDAFTDINTALEKYGKLLESARSGTLTPEDVAEVDKEIKIYELEYLVEEIPYAIQQSLEGISRIAKIIQSMKDFAHPGTKEKTAVDINKAIESTATVSRNEWKYVAELEMSLDDDLPLVPCLLGEFNQVILNMIINASHAITDAAAAGDGTQGKGKITITTTRANEEWVEIRVADTGTGIPPEVQERIFDPFFTTKEVGRGTGQGLAISHTVVVEKHGGKLNFETEPGKGTTFTIQLPLETGKNSFTN